MNTGAVAAMIGAAYFADGHVETITSIRKYSDDDIVFHTRTGMYHIGSYIDETDNGIKYKKYTFRKFITATASIDAYWIVVEIDRIELYKEEN